MKYAWLTLSVALLASALPTQAQDLERGRRVFEECVACHSLQPGEHVNGPSLAGLIGRRAATLEGFRFSSALRKSNLVWDEDTLSRFVADPQAVVPGNRMPYSGLSGAEDLAALMAFLRSFAR